MPIYDYLCTACDHRADILHGINDPGPLYCPSCGAEGTMRKQFAVPAIHYKGSGWAKKDRGSSTSTKAASRSSDASRSGESGSGESRSGESGSGGSGSGESTGATSSSSDGGGSSSSTVSSPDGGGSSSPTTPSGSTD